MEAGIWGLNVVVKGVVMLVEYLLYIKGILFIIELNF